MEIICLRGKKPSTQIVMQRKTIKPLDLCAKCNKYFNKQDLEIEHPIPVFISGDNLTFNIYCKSCHKDKTKKDIVIINCFKKLGFIKKINVNYNEVFDKLTLIKIYNELINKMDEMEKQNE